MTALALILMLIIMLLLLFLIHQPEEKDNWEAYDSSGEYDESHWDDSSDEEEDDRHETEEYEYREENAGGGGGGDGDGEEPGTDEGEYPEEGDGIKAAVLVQLVDAETDKVIKEPGVQFELYQENGTLEILHTYYPERTPYRIYETTKDGIFYLPEKIWEDRSYYLHELTEASGYDMADNTAFTIDDAQIYDWPDPFVVNVPVYPSRNKIRIRMTDQATGKTVAGGSFDIVAAENVITADGTIRYKSGEVVGTIEVGEDGTGESEELFLGTYYLKESVIPEFYSSVAGNITKTVAKRTGGETEVEVIGNERTKIVFSLKDELTEAAIAGAEFAVSHGGQEEIYQTDNTGKIEIESVDKDTTYVFRQMSAPAGYILPESDIKIDVSKTGRFGTENTATGTVEGTNRILRVKVGVVDAVLKTQISDTDIEIYNEQDEVIKSWTANKASVTLTDLEEGRYYMVVNGKSGKKYPFTVTNTAQIQGIEMTVWTVKSYLVIIGASVVGLGLLFGAFMLLRWMLRRKKSRPKEKGRSKES